MTYVGEETEEFREFRAYMTEVLRLVNVARDACGKGVLDALRDGDRDSPWACPLASSLGDGTVGVEDTFAVFLDSDDAAAVRRAWETSAAGFVDTDEMPWSRTARLPDALMAFIRDFDSRRIAHGWLILLQREAAVRSERHVTPS